MKTPKYINYTGFLVLLGLFLMSSTMYAQDNFREKIRERIREKWVEKKRQETNNQETEIGLGGIDARIPVKWITEKKEAGFVYGTGDYGRKLQFGGMERFYEIHAPQSYNKTKFTPVVLNFHGGGGYPAGA